MPAAGAAEVEKTAEPPAVAGVKRAREGGDAPADPAATDATLRKFAEGAAVLATATDPASFLQAARTLEPCAVMWIAFRADGAAMWGAVDGSVLVRVWVPAPTAGKQRLMGWGAYHAAVGADLTLEFDAAQFRRSLAAVTGENPDEVHLAVRLVGAAAAPSVSVMGTRQGGFRTAEIPTRATAPDALPDPVGLLGVGEPVGTVDAEDLARAVNVTPAFTVGTRAARAALLALVRVGDGVWLRVAANVEAGSIACGGALIRVVVAEGASAAAAAASSVSSTVHDAPAALGAMIEFGRPHGAAGAKRHPASEDGAGAGAGAGAKRVRPTPREGPRVFVGASDQALHLAWWVLAFASVDVWVPAPERDADTAARVQAAAAVTRGGRDAAAGRG